MAMYRSASSYTALRNFCAAVLSSGVIFRWRRTVPLLVPAPLASPAAAGFAMVRSAWIGQPIRYATCFQFQIQTKKKDLRKTARGGTVHIYRERRDRVRSALRPVRTRIVRPCSFLRGLVHPRAGKDLLVDLFGPPGHTRPGPSPTETAQAAAPARSLPLFEEQQSRTPDPPPPPPPRLNPPPPRRVRGRGSHGEPPRAPRDPLRQPPAEAHAAPRAALLRAGVRRADRPLRLQGGHPALPRVHVRLLRRRGPHAQHGGQETPPGPLPRRQARLQEGLRHSPRPARGLARPVPHRGHPRGAGAQGQRRRREEEGGGGRRGGGGGQGEALDGGREGRLLQGRMRQGRVREPWEAGEEEEGWGQGEGASRGRRGQVPLDRDAPGYRETEEGETLSTEEGNSLEAEITEGIPAAPLKEVESLIVLDLSCCTEPLEDPAIKRGCRPWILEFAGRSILFLNYQINTER